MHQHLATRKKQAAKRRSIRDINQSLHSIVDVR